MPATYPVASDVFRHPSVYISLARRACVSLAPWTVTAAAAIGKQSVPQIESINICPALHSTLTTEGSGCSQGSTES